MLVVVLFLAALVVFILGALGVPAGRTDWLHVGLALLAGGFLAGAWPS